MNFFAKLLLLSFFAVNYCLAQQSVPSDVMDEITASVEARYPDRPDLVEFVVNRQIAGYESLQKMTLPKGMSAETFTELKDKYATEFPKDFSAQAYRVQKQVDAFNYIEDFQPGKIPPRAFDYEKKLVAKVVPLDFVEQRDRLITMDINFRMPESWNGDMPEGY